MAPFEVLFDRNGPWLNRQYLTLKEMLAMNMVLISSVSFLAVRRRDSNQYSRSRLTAWRERMRYRSELKRLLAIGPHMIADIGLTQEAVRHEIEKPMWVA